MSIKVECKVKTYLEEHGLMSDAPELLVTSTFAKPDMVTWLSMSRLIE